MTLDNDKLTTNEFLRRRKLRLQQVREQSKDIARKIRQRAEVEKLRHVNEIDSKKAKEYFECQEKLVKRLELLYSKSLDNVGSGHKNALEVDQKDTTEKVDLSKSRGKEAVAELRKKKQQKLDEQKKILDRKLQAREVANELSREKSSVVTKKITNQKNPDDANIVNNNFVDIENGHIQNKDDQINNKSTTKNDMGTQWEVEELNNEWEPNIPSLSLPRDDSVKDSNTDNIEKSDKSKKLNLFALSDEMPSSLRGGLTEIVYEPTPVKTSLTVVSEYLQNRNLRLREHKPSTSKIVTEDLQSIKQTILRTRVTKTNGNVFDNVCRVLDEQIIPVPMWQAEKKHFCGQSCEHKCLSNTSRHFSRSLINNNPALLGSFRKHLDSSRVCQPVFAKQNAIRKSNVYPGTFMDLENNKSHSTEPESSHIRKKLVTVYNHNTRDARDIPCDEDKLVHLDNKSEDDAYAQALMETRIANDLEREQLNKKQQEMRNKVAVTKQNVDREYRDTLTFLNSLSKDMSDKPIKKAYMDDQQKQAHKEKYQRKMQQEFKKIEKECSKHHTCKHSKRKVTVLDSSKNKAKSPVIIDEETTRPFEYSWMPVPESDGNLAIHTIPNIVKNKTGNNVKFSQTDSYHEYRSRHKHTPPTKDASNKPNGKIVETVLLEQNSNESEDNENSLASETSSVENLSLEKDKIASKVDPRFEEAERIIIYKILESKKDKNSKRQNRYSSNKQNSKSLSSKDKNVNSTVEKNDNGTDKEAQKNPAQTGDGVHKGVSFEQLHEGIYKTVSSDGDNITSMYFPKELQESEATNQEKQIRSELIMPCCCSQNQNIYKAGNDKDVRKEGGDTTSGTPKKTSCKCVNFFNPSNNCVSAQPSAATSASSFKTASNDKTQSSVPDNGFVKLIEDGQDSGKFYIGASGFLKDNSYEVVIQLRKKDGEKSENKVETVKVDKTTSLPSQTNAPKAAERHLSTLVEECNNSEANIKEPSINEQIPPQSASQSVETNTDNNNEQKIQTPSKEQILIDKTISKPQSNNLCEKAAHTSFHDSYAIPEHVPKTDTTSRPATSTYTQTSFNSSMPRPAFMHMSSSTSTAYMSPPELILPKFLRQGHIMANEDIYGSENTMSHTDMQYEVIEPVPSKQFQECTCKRCIYSRHLMTDKNKTQMRHKNKTPPNTARTFDTDTNLDSASTKKRKCKCRKCKSHSETKICHRPHKKRTRSVGYTKSLSSNNSYIKLIRSPKNKISCAQNNKNASGTKLNPVIKSYVNKLLALNNEGLKAIEIINQDCSSVSTPGSSVINLPSNKDKIKSTIDNKISLEQIKNILKKQVLRENFAHEKDKTKSSGKNNETQTGLIPKLFSKLPKRKPVHKVKSLNISKHVLKTKKSMDSKLDQPLKIHTSSSSSVKYEQMNQHSNQRFSNSRSKSSLSRPTTCKYSEYRNNTSSDVEPCNSKSSKTSTTGNNLKTNSNDRTHNHLIDLNDQLNKRYNFARHRATATSISSDSEATGSLFNNLNQQHNLPLNISSISTQTNKIVDTEINFMKIAEDKLQNMEKIADLTEKCTKRLSNLAKVLEEVRRNKSLVYSQISSSDCASDSDQKSDKNVLDANILNTKSEPNILMQQTVKDAPNTLNIQTTYPDIKSCSESSGFTPILKDIPKPTELHTSDTPSGSNEDSVLQKTNVSSDYITVKCKGKPPPALTRLNLKYGHDILVTPHELSTVLEVDSPMSMKLRNQSCQDVHSEPSNKSSKKSYVDESEKKQSKEHVDPDLLQCNVNMSKQHFKISSTDSSDDSKMRMMDMKQFNDIMLKPFISLQEYANQCNIGLDEESNIEDVVKDDVGNEELSSLHSDGSLPDVIAELLKRNIISEPFKYESASNINSTTMSSESSLSILALSKAKKEKKKSGVFLKNKENKMETSETLSISSNPDLENAFQKLGMGWASSTLKKTKERLALSSSSNTSSSSLTQFKIKSFSHEVPSNSLSSLINISSKDEKKKSQTKHVRENSKNAVQQTSLSNSMTVKEFLNNELSKKITFNNKSSRKDAEGDFISLYETKMPEELKNTEVPVEEDQSSIASVNNNRARTSTPVQIFKSSMYKTSSSSNTSNGLFSNADDLSSVKVTSTSIRHSTSDKDDLTIPNYSLKPRKISDCSKSE